VSLAAIDAPRALGPATRDAWSTPELPSRHADLVEWRDRLYATHRARRA
jgi:hypothetical protein